MKSNILTGLFLAFVFIYFMINPSVKEGFDLETEPAYTYKFPPIHGKTTTPLEHYLNHHRDSSCVLLIDKNFYQDKYNYPSCMILNCKDTQKNKNSNRIDPCLSCVR